MAEPAGMLYEARLAFARGRVEVARLRYRAAFECARAAGDATAMAEAALGQGGMWLNDRRSTADYAEYRARLEEALARVRASQPELAARLRLRLAAEACYAEGGSIDAVFAAVAGVRAFGDPVILAESLSLLHHLLITPHARAEREATSRELVAVAAGAGDEFFALMGLMWSTIDSFLAGDDDAVAMLEQLRVRAVREEVAVLDYLVRTIDVMLLLRAGRLADVEALLDDLLEVGTDVGEVDAFTWYGAHLLALRWLQGRTAEMLPLARELADSPQTTRFNRAYPAVVAALAAEHGDHDAAAAALARVHAFAEPPFGLARSTLWHFTMTTVVEAISRLGDADAASAAYDALAPFADLPVLASLAVVCLGSTHRPLAQCAATMGDPTLALAHRRAAVDHNARLGNLPLLAITRAELAAALPDCDHVEADALYDAALAAARDYGMPGWVERWERERDRLRSAALG